MRVYTPAPMPRRASSIRAALACSSLALAVTNAASAAEPLSVEVELMNDLGAVNDLVDDLYSGGLALRVARGRWRVALEENLFTDRAADVRFDETWLLGAWAPPPLGGWRSRLEAGAVHVGDGLFGEDVQNAIHRVINEPELQLDYIAEDDEHAVLGVEVWRTFREQRRVGLGPWLEAREAFGFKSSVAAGGTIAWRISQPWRLSGRLLSRWTESVLPELERRIDEDEPHVELSLQRRRWLRATYAHNEYGTGDQHWHLAFTWHARGQPGSRPEVLDPRYRQSAN